MKRPHILLSCAWLLHTAAWLLPVVKGGTQLPHGLPGWEAWRVSFAAVWPYEGASFDAWYWAVLSTVSAVTTLFFVLGSPLVILRGSHSLLRASAWVAASAFVINSYWYIFFGSDRASLRIGYFVWWLSFMFLAVGLFDSARLGRVDEVDENRAVTATST